MAADGEPNNQARDKSPPASCPRGASRPLGWQDTHKKSMGDALLYHLLDRKGSLSRGVRLIMGCRERAFWDCTRNNGMFGRNQTWVRAESRWNKHVKGRDKGKKHWSHAKHANKWLVRPCTSPNQCSLSCLLIELHFQFLSCMRALCSACMSVWRSAC